MKTKTVIISPAVPAQVIPGKPAVTETEFVLNEQEALFFMALIGNMTGQDVHEVLRGSIWKKHFKNKLKILNPSSCIDFSDALYRSMDGEFKKGGMEPEYRTR